MVGPGGGLRGGRESGDDIEGIVTEGCDLSLEGSLLS